MSLVGQGLPPLSAGLLIILNFSEVPIPQVALHVDQLDQSETIQSTGGETADKVADGFPEIGSPLKAAEN